MYTEVDCGIQQVRYRRESVSSLGPQGSVRMPCQASGSTGKAGALLCGLRGKLKRPPYAPWCCADVAKRVACKEVGEVGKIGEGDSRQVLLTLAWLWYN